MFTTSQFIANALISQRFLQEFKTAESFNGFSAVVVDRIIMISWPRVHCKNEFIKPLSYARQSPQLTSSCHRGALWDDDISVQWYEYDIHTHIECASFVAKFNVTFALVTSTKHYYQTFHDFVLGDLVGKLCGPHYKSITQQSYLKRMDENILREM